jgi:hypothetical protein
LRMSSQSGGLSYRPRFGFNFPARIFNAVLLPIPFVPTSPSTCPGLGIGNLWSLKLLAEKRWVTCVSRLVGKLMMLIAPKGHFFGQIPHPIHSRSEMNAILDSAVTSIQSFPVLTTGQDFRHSWRHFCVVNMTPPIGRSYLWLALSGKSSAQHSVYMQNTPRWLFVL